jgi:phosphoribosylamine--glycine ligase
MNILVIGSGGREHALIRQILKSRKTAKIFAVPGNAGMAEFAECEPIAPENIDGLVDFARKRAIDLTIVGPELPLTLGIIDAFEANGLTAFGPTKRASALEGSKAFTKEFCARHGIPTAPFRCFEEASHAREYLRANPNFPVVIKADGLAAGKGVVIAKTPEEADKAVSDMMLYERFGTAGRKVVIEDFLTGEEASFIVIVDGTEYVAFPASQDHKRIFDGDSGPNTGGMGAYAPAPVVTDAVRTKIMERVIEPTLKGLIAEDRRYRGFLYAGLMIDAKGDPHLIEYNCRLGDPEAEVILPLLKTDLITLIEHALMGKLSHVKAEFEDGSCAGVVLASRGYPGDFEKGKLISGLESIDDDDPDVAIFHCGTRKKPEGFFTDGGRVLVVSAKAKALEGAIRKAYGAVSKIGFDGMHFRRDIGAKGLKPGRIAIRPS